MAYVPIEYPTVRYGPGGLPVITKNAGEVAALPSTFTSAPKTASLVAFPPVLLAQAVKIPPSVAVMLPPTLTKLIELNSPTKKGSL